MFYLCDFFLRNLYNTCYILFTYFQTFYLLIDGLAESLLLHRLLSAFHCSGVQASHCSGFFCFRAQALGPRASVVEASRLQKTGSVVAHGLILCLKNFGCAVWHMGSQFPYQGSNPPPLHQKCGVLTTGPPRKIVIFSLDS